MAVLKELGLGGTGAWRVRRAYMVVRARRPAPSLFVPYGAQGTRALARARGLGTRSKLSF